MTWKIYFFQPSAFLLYQRCNNFNFYWLLFKISNEFSPNLKISWLSLTMKIFFFDLWQSWNCSLSRKCSCACNRSNLVPRLSLHSSLEAKGESAWELGWLPSSWFRHHSTLPSYFYNINFKPSCILSSATETICQVEFPLFNKSLKLYLLT